MERGSSKEVRKEGMNSSVFAKEMGTWDRNRVTRPRQAFQREGK
jgi:hypothetical protein